MSEPNKIKYLRHHQVDKAKYDQCISNAPNGLIYAYSFYLDHMAKRWDALVLNDYEVVMPLPWNRKFGVKYLYQPFLTAQLGVFGKGITKELVERFVQAIPSSFRLIEISLNSGNPEGADTGIISERSNFVLDMNRPYDDLYNNYRENIQRNIRKAVNLGCVAEIDFDVERVIKLAVGQMEIYSKESSKNVNRFRKLYWYLHARQMATTWCVRVNNVILASCVFFFSHHRAYYILVGNDPKGKSIGASHALIDTFVKENAGKRMILDFEGSDIPNLAFFYSSFGAVHETYPSLRINRLPFYLKWLKD
jgi:Acetyltransferase (GNAT) domain